MSKGLIILDPGHGKTGNPHTTKAGYYEGTQNFVLSQYLRDELVARGFDVKVTRETVDDNPELAERGSMAGRLGAKMFLSLHSNAPGASRSPEEYARVRGAETYYSVTDEDGNAPIARALNDAVVRTMGTLDRGIKTRRHPDDENTDYYAVISPTMRTRIIMPLSATPRSRAAAVRFLSSTASTRTPRIPPSCKAMSALPDLPKPRRRSLTNISPEISDIFCLRCRSGSQFWLSDRFLYNGINKYLNISFLC